LLVFVHTLLPAGDAVTLVGDSGLGSVAVLRQLDKWHWFYVLRQKANTGVWLNEQSGWKVFGTRTIRSGL
jgi:ABC-type phosphate/phosphonate transport system ATPase subunit